MARIRTIKPEFWTDDAIMQCSMQSRLFFIGMWNHSDDNGNIERSPNQLKVKIFPSDDINVEPLILELISQNLLIEYESAGKNYLNIRSFSKHQKIKNKSIWSLPEYRPSTLLPQSSPTTTPVLPLGIGVVGVDVKELEWESKKELELETEGMQGEAKAEWAENVFLTTQEANLLCKTFGQKAADSYIRHLSTHKKTTGNEFESDYNKIMEMFTL